MRNFIHIGLGLMVLLLLVVGCSRKDTASTSTIVLDCTYVKEVPRFVEVKIPGNTVEVTRWIECDSNTNKPKPFITKKKSGRATVTVEVKATGEMNTTSTCDSLNEKIKVLDKEIFRLRHEKKTETKIVYEHDPYWFDIASRWIAGVTVLAVVGYSLAKFNKLI